MTHQRGKSGRCAARRHPPRARADEHYTAQARQAGFRARSVYKLEQLDRKYRLIKPGARVVDLGAAPGSWSQYVAARINPDARVIAVDLRAMKPLAKVDFIRGDFTDAAVLEQVVGALGGLPADLVLSDIAPNISGIPSADQARAEAQQLAVLAFCHRALRPGGKLLTKLFAGEAADATRARFAACFEEVRALKPDASRAASREIYLLAHGYHGGKSGGGGERAAMPGEGDSEGAIPARNGLYWAPGAPTRAAARSSGNPGNRHYEGSTCPT